MTLQEIVKTLLEKYEIDPNKKLDSGQTASEWMEGWILGGVEELED